MPGPFRDVRSHLAFPELEERVLRFWRETDAFRRSVELRKDAPRFVFLEGPPTANGRMGAHHVLSRVMKDVVCRYKAMTGHCVERKGGWDTHGLPVEIEVEKALGISGKQQIEAYGVREFVEKCRQSVFAYEQDWRRTTERIGFWIDMDDPYVTLTNDYIESVWHVLRRLWDKGLLDQGHKVVPYCPRCGTALSSHEVAQGYQEVEDPSLYVKFPVRGEPNTYFLVWTTTPWTLPSNVALAVNPDADYATVPVRNPNTGKEERLIVAQRLAKQFLGVPSPIYHTEPGRKLVGMEYEPLFSFVQPKEKAHYVVSADFVTLQDGTGIVHIAPAFGQDDYELGQKHGLPLVQLVGTEGNFVEAVAPWAGQFVKDADPLITRNLAERGLIHKVETYRHDYPFCWRCDTPLLYYARASWFIKTTAFKDRMVEQNRRVNWYPEHIKEGRFGDWLANNVDWAVSRERYWGTPLPIWKCETCGHAHCVGSEKELRELGRDVPADLEFHRPYIDTVILDCPKCGAAMRRVPEVADAWLDSGCAHTAQWHYPFENEGRFRRSYPADFITEAIDQTRGWFYSLLATGVFLYGESPYRNCLCLELVLGADGQKMSKSRGNAVDPWTVLAKQGADAMRWYFFTVSPPWEPRAFSEDAVNAALLRFLGTVYNVYAFFVLYANADGLRPREDAPRASGRPPMDRWILSRYHTLVGKVRAEMEGYQMTRAARAVEDFVDDLSNWYVRRCRSRFWGTTNETDKRAAFATLYEALVGASQVLAPFTPFLAEDMYRNLVLSLDPTAPESVHFCDYPTADASLVDEALEASMALARKVVALGRAARNASGHRVRQPMSRVLVGGLTPEQRESLAPLTDTVLDELNLRALEWADGLEDFAQYRAKANFRTLGPKYGKAAQALARAVQEADAASLQRNLDRLGALSVPADGQNYTLLPEDVSISLESRGGYSVVAEAGMFVALDTTLTPELIEAGIARELVNRIQAMRKAAGFHVSDRIVLTLNGSAKALAAFQSHKGYVTGETLAVRVEAVPGPNAFVKQHTLGGEQVTVSVERVVHQ